MEIIGYDLDQAGKFITNLKRSTDVKKALGAVGEIKHHFQEIEKKLIDAENTMQGKSASITNMLDRVAASLEEKGYLKEAEEIDAISNSIEAYSAINYKAIAKNLSNDASFKKILMEMKKEVSPKGRALLQDLSGADKDQGLAILLNQADDVSKDEFERGLELGKENKEDITEVNAFLESHPDAVIAEIVTDFMSKAQGSPVRDYANFKKIKEYLKKTFSKKNKEEEAVEDI